MKEQGNIGVTSANIFPIIKKFLYSDHEIFLRELVSNAVDATQKLKTLASVGEFKGELGELQVTVSVDKSKGTITVSDHGIGMTGEEIEKYINQIAFSGAEEFVNKYKDNAAAIIGHFGLGFYSSFMVAKKVEIITKSFKEDTQAVRWSCQGDPEYTMKEADRTDRGTDIILHIDDENTEFLEESRIQTLLDKYCKFLAIPVAFGEEKEWKEGKEISTGKAKIINNPNPAWTRNPSDLKEEDYKSFYKELYPMAEEPMFWIHLNVDYPFKLTGILYFPKIKGNLDLNRNKIQLYCNQVFVTDSVEGIVPEFLTLLHGVIDSPDIPLNVSRSYLQSDGNVKKISSHITKKVSDRLAELFKHDRKEFENKWEDLKLFIQYGSLTDEKFFERAEKFTLLKNVDGLFFTFEEYKTLIESGQTDKDSRLVYLYTNDPESQYSYIDAAKAKGYDVLLMNGQLDSHYAGRLEQKLDKSSFVRVDGDTIDNLIAKNNKIESHLAPRQKEELNGLFESKLPTIEKVMFQVSCEALGSEGQPALVTQNEFMRRMKEMSAMQSGMNFYGEMPDSYNLIINTDHPLCQKVLTDAEAQCTESLKPIYSEVEGLETQRAELDKKHKDMKWDEIPQAEKDQKSALDKQIEEVNGKKKAILSECATRHELIPQLIDIALLSSGMLKGKALSDFIKRSVSLLK